MIKNMSFAKITDILLKKMRSVIVSQNHYLYKILDVHPLAGHYMTLQFTAPHWDLDPHLKAERPSKTMERSELKQNSAS